MPEAKTSPPTDDDDAAPTAAAVAELPRPARKKGGAADDVDADDDGAERGTVECEGEETEAGGAGSGRDGAAASRTGEDAGTPRQPEGAEGTGGPEKPAEPERPGREKPAEPELPGQPQGLTRPRRSPDPYEPSEASPLPERTGLTPRQARRVRIVVSGVVMAAVAVALAVRLASAPSVLTVGFYGIALILSGVALSLSRRGRTRVATGVLALGFASVALAEWMLATAV